MSTAHERVGIAQAAEEIRMMKERRVIVTLLLLAVGAGVGLSHFLVARTLLAREAHLRAYPVSLRMQDKVAWAPDVVRVVLYGDSRIEEWVQPPFEEVANLGVSGATAAELFGALPEWFLPAPEVVVIQCGINDIKSIAYSGQNPETVANRVTGAINFMAAHWRKLGAEQVVVTGIMPTAAIPLKRRPFWSGEVESLRRKINAALEKQPGFTFVSTEFLAEDNAFYRDALHLSARGYSKLVEVLGEQGLRLLN